MKFRPRARWALLLPLIFAPLLPGNPLLGQAVAQDASSPQDDAAKRLQWLKSKGLAGSATPAKSASGSASPSAPASNANANASAAGAAILKKRFSETRSQQLRPLDAPAPAEGNAVAKKTSPPSTPAASEKATASAASAPVSTGTEAPASKAAGGAKETANSKSTATKEPATGKIASKEKESTAKTAGTKEPTVKEAAGTTSAAKGSATAKATSKEKETAAKTAGAKEPTVKEPAGTTAATKEGTANTATTAKSGSAKEGAATSKTAAAKDTAAPKTASTDGAPASTVAAKGKKTSGSEKTTASAVGAGPATPAAPATPETRTAKGTTSEKASGAKDAKTASAAPAKEPAVATTKETATKGSANKEKETAGSTAKTKDQPTKETKAAAVAAAKSEAAAEAAKKTASSEKTTGKDKEKGAVAAQTTKSEPQSSTARATDTAATRALLKTPATAAIPSTTGSTRGSKTAAPTSLTNPESLMPSRTAGAAASNNVTITTRTMGASSRYPWKNNIVTTVFWVGERPAGNNFTPNYASSWDAAWSRSYGGFDNPDPDHRRNFIPIKFTPRQNPFYVALPYNDVTRGTTKPEARRVIPWFRDAYTREGQSVCHNRWVAIRSRSGRIAYAQWSDCGPFRTDHWQYVFGNERPKPNLNQGAGLDVSPAVRDYLGLAGTDITDWRFVDTREVPHGPWAIYGDNNTVRRNGPRMAESRGGSTKPGRAGNLTVAQVP